MIMKMVNPAFAEAKGRSGQSEQTQVWVDICQVSQDLLVLALFIITDAMTFIDD